MIKLKITLESDIRLPNWEHGTNSTYKRNMQLLDKERLENL